MTRICSNCGTDLLEFSLFCSECGFHLMHDSVFSESSWLRSYNNYLLEVRAISSEPLFVSSYRVGDK